MSLQPSWAELQKSEPIDYQKKGVAQKTGLPISYDLERLEAAKHVNKQ